MTGENAERNLKAVMTDQSADVGHRERCCLQHLVRHRAPVFLTLLILLITRSVSGAQEITVQEFAAKVNKNVDAFEKYFENVGVKIRYEKRFVAATDEFKSSEGTRHYEFIARKPHYRLKGTSNPDAKESRAEVIGFINKDGCFRVVRPTGKKEQVLPVSAKECGGFLLAMFEDAMIPRAAFWSIHEPVREVLNGPGWNVVRQGEDLYKAMRQYEVKSQLCQEEIVFSARLRMAVVSCRETWPSSETAQTIDYDGESNGVPLIKRVERSAKDRLGTGKYVWEVEEWIPSPFHDADFALERFGITAPAPQSFSPPFWFYFLVLFFVFLILASVFGRIAKYYSRTGH